MAFKLEIRFTGLCLYVQHPSARYTAVLMPNATNGTRPRHHDGTVAVPHVAYLNVDPRNVMSGIGALGQSSSPGKGIRSRRGQHFDVVYRFSGQTLDLGLKDDAMAFRSTATIPDFSDFAPGLTLRPDLFTRNVPRAPTGGSAPALLLRTMLHGGALANAREVEGVWCLDRLPRSTNPSSIVFPMCGEALWTREISDAHSMVITISDFNGTKDVELTLDPGDDGVIRLGLANLCTENPLEWPELPDRETILEDSDFKWLYTLFKPPANAGARVEQDEWDDYLSHCVLPAPKLLSQINPNPSPIQTNALVCRFPPGGCAAATKTETTDFPPLTDWAR